MRALLITLGLSFAAFSQVKTEVPPVEAGAKPVTIEKIKIHGVALEGNLEGNAVDRDAIVYLPPGYASNKRKRYPVVYALHGYSIGAEQWSKEIHTPQVIEGAFVQGAQEMIVVLPDSKTVHNGSMYSSSVTTGDFEKYIARSFYFWMVRFLRTRYTQVQIVFVTHHTEAREVDEDTFFNLGESGGTKVSSAYQLALDIADERYPASEWNTYPFHFSDGDNWGEVDNQRCLDLVKALLNRSNAFGYGEIQEGGRRSPSTLMSAFGQIRDPHFIGVTITRKEDVYPALKQFFSTRDEAGLAAVAQ